MYNNASFCEKIILAEHLSDMSIYFANYETFEEIPLVSRDKNISFLSGFVLKEKNEILLRCAISHLDYVVDFVDENKIINENYFICLSIIDFKDTLDELDFLRINFFVSNKTSWLLSHLKLSYFEIKKHKISDLFDQDALSRFELFENTPNENETHRLFLISKEFFPAMLLPLLNDSF